VFLAKEAWVGWGFLYKQHHSEEKFGDWL
jgi:hypothetical protein